MTSEPSKSEIAINWIGHGMLRVLLDPRHDGVIVPSYLRKQSTIALEWGFDLPRPIPDLKLDPEAISGTLCFSHGRRAGVGLRMWCVVPWPAVYALVSETQKAARLWINDAPPEVRRDILVKAGARANAKMKSGRKQARQMKGHLRLVKKGTGA